MKSTCLLSLFLPSRTENLHISSKSNPKSSPTSATASLQCLHSNPTSTLPFNPRFKTRVPKTKDLLL
ncbi:hypothetical protein COLO4_11822 [Corchorus olitorius]|uniref:Uncharacterized protein n=1 Tax=Corchorus olitorius TaxID=93759 RepID=A0A1R3K332_9ROSI|nr:hypothetical protein COLO4_11822 [Corchorus olitorius]